MMTMVRVRVHAISSMKRLNDCCTHFHLIFFFFCHRRRACVCGIFARHITTSRRRRAAVSWRLRPKNRGWYKKAFGIFPPQNVRCITHSHGAAVVEVVEMCDSHPSTFSGQSQTDSFRLKTKFCGQGMWCFLFPSHM